ncbi:MAG TPA: RNA polymerase sigma factor [Solirubrobacterales bacterium]|jgi:RNA polymerase sigma factor (sigma-70 family)|nr:RNA polymerase sigma factor [Solirubrobacterales bacterium]
MPPPPAEPIATRVFLGPALRTQSDRRLVTLVRDGYEAAFEEIVRRYRKPLDRFAAVFVGDRSEDVTQDAFSKALLALRGSEKEIELRPWLYRIVRNAALNDLRDRPPAAAELGEEIAAGHSAAIEAERREEMAELMERLRALPEPQRAAIVMRELEGLSHEEIAAALGVSGGAARQAIYRARATLRDGFGMLVPLPLLRLLFDHGAEAAAGAGGAAAAAGAASAAGGGGAALGGIGAAGALKVGVATALLAGSVGAGVALQKDRGGGDRPARTATEAALVRPGSEAGAGSGGSSSNGGSAIADGEDRGGNRGPGDGRRHDDGRRDDQGGHGKSGSDDGGADDFDDSSSGSGGPGPSGHGGSGSRHGGRPEAEDDSGGGGPHSGEGVSGGGGSGRHGSGDSSGSTGSNSSSGSGSSGGSGGGSGDGGSDGGSGGSSGHSGSSGGPAPAPSPTPGPEPPPEESGGSGSGGSDDSGSGGSGSGSDGSGSGSGEADS